MTALTIINAPLFVCLSRYITSIFLRLQKNHLHIHPKLVEYKVGFSLQHLRKFRHSFLFLALLSWQYWRRFYLPSSAITGDLKENRSLHNKCTWKQVTSIRASVVYQLVLPIAKISSLNDISILTVVNISFSSKLLVIVFLVSTTFQDKIIFSSLIYFKRFSWWYLNYIPLV